jgi:hypothetical protein
MANPLELYSTFKIFALLSALAVFPAAASEVTADPRLVQFNTTEATTTAKAVTGLLVTGSIYAYLVYAASVLIDTFSGDGRSHERKDFPAFFRSLVRPLPKKFRLAQLPSLPRNTLPQNDGTFDFLPRI